MLIEPKSYLYTYPITRDFGFAPNPFYGFCTLATCKPNIRKSAQIGDWILGVGGSGLKKQIHKKCIFLMKVTEKMSFEEYWRDERFIWKKPTRNGSNIQMIGDNIYHKDTQGSWLQEDSHHSNPDGTVNLVNLKRDTGEDKKGGGFDNVLISNNFLYFGSEAVPADLTSIGHVRIRDYKKTDLSISEDGIKIIESIYLHNKNKINIIIADPCQFLSSHQRVDQKTGKLS